MGYATFWTNISTVLISHKLGQAVPAREGQFVDRPRMPCYSSLHTVKSLGYTYTFCDLSAQWTSSGRLKSVNALGASWLCSTHTHTHTHTHITSNLPSLTHFFKLIPIVFAKQRISQRLPHGVVCLYVCMWVCVCTGCTLDSVKRGFQWITMAPKCRALSLTLPLSRLI